MSVRWLALLIGIQATCFALEVSEDGFAALAEAAAEIALIPTDLQRLTLHGRAIDSTALPGLGIFPDLRTLVLLNTSPVADAFATLPQLPALEELIYDDRTFADRHISHLAQFTTLQRLDLSRTAVATPGIAYLCNHLTQLTRLTLDRTRVDDEVLPHLAKLPMLESLSLIETRVSPAGLRRLNAPALRSLRLSGLVPADLSNLAHLTALKSLTIMGSPQNAATTGTSLPGVAIEWR